MQLEDKVVEDILIVKPMESRIDSALANNFKKKMLEWIKGGHNRIVLDLSVVNFIDSSGLGAIVSSLKAISKNGDLVIFGVTETVMDLFLLTRMDRVFQLFPSEVAAINALSGKHSK